MRFALAALLVPALALAVPSPGPETYLFRASVPDHGLVVFLPESEIRSREAAAAYLEWARKTHPAYASSLRGVWASESLELPVLWPKEAALLRKGNSAVSASGTVRLIVDGPPEKGRIALRLPEPPPFGTADPNLCVSNVWVLSREELFARWSAELQKHPDEGRGTVRQEMEALLASGRYSRDGGDVWRSAVEDFRTNTPALWPRLRLENRTGIPIRVAVPSENAVTNLPAGGVWSMAVRRPPDTDFLEWRARPADRPEFLDIDYRWETNRIAWSRAASSDVRYFFDVPPGTLLPPPVLVLPDSYRSIPSGMIAKVSYADGSSDTMPIHPHTDGRNCIEVALRRTVASLTVSAPGFEDKTLKFSVKLNRGNETQLELPPPTPVVPPSPPEPSPEPPRPEPAPVAPAQPEPSPSASSSSAPPPPEPSPPVQPAVHPIEPWPGIDPKPGTPPPPWPWTEPKRQQTWMRSWWDMCRQVKVHETSRNASYYLNQAMGDLDKLLQPRPGYGNESLKNAYRHVAACPGCADCRPHRADMQSESGFEDQRWALFRSLLLRSGVDWSVHVSTDPPTRSKIDDIRKRLEAWKKKHSNR